jgi:hypothetical protein
MIDIKINLCKQTKNTDLDEEVYDDASKEA